MDNRNIKRNAGVTLIELIVVLAIMAILTSAFGISISLISRRRVKNAAADTKQLIQLAQTYAKSKGYCKLSIEGSDDGSSNVYIYVAESQADLSDPTKCRLGDGPSNVNKKIKVEVCYEVGTGITKMDMVIELASEDHFADINFDRRIGGVTDSYFKGNYGSHTDYSNHGIPQWIRFTNGDNVSTLVIATYTGVVTYK